MKFATRINIYFYGIAIVVAVSGLSFLKYGKTHHTIWLVLTILFALTFFALAIDLFRWWAKVYKE